MPKRVLNVGQCALDHSNISELLNNHFEVEIEKASSHDEAVSLAQQSIYDLILVNRIYDADGSPGQTTVAELCENDSSPVMLVSNYPDAQAAAQAAGAVSGFGKSQLGNAETVAKLAAHLS